MDPTDFKIEDLPIHILDSNLTLLPSTSGIQNTNASDSESDFNCSEDDDDDCDEEDTFSDADDCLTKNLLDSSPGSKSSKKKSVIRKHVSRLPKTLKGLMGEANLRYARGEVDVAEKICYEVIRQAPDAYEPYLTLTQIYETKDPKKCEIFLTLATRLNTHDVTSWCRLADYMLKGGKLKDAVSCYTNALRADPKNIDLHLKRLQLAERIGHKKTILKFKAKLASHLPKKRHEDIIKIIKEVVTIYHEEGAYAKAIEALDIPFRRIPKKVSQDLVNMMLELLLLTNKYVQCIDVFTQFCGFEFELDINDDNSIDIHRCDMPETTQVDIRSKFIICAVKLKCLYLASGLINNLLMSYEADKIGDLYLDIAEALMQEGHFEEALKLLVPLVKSKDYSLAAVWLKYAECLNKCNMFEQAVEAYFTVMALAPKHIEVIYPLATLLLQQGKEKEAFEVLSAQDTSSGKLDVSVLIERLKLLKKMGNVKEYFKCAELLLSRHCVIFRNPEEIRFALTSHIKSDKIQKIKKMREFRGDLTQVINEVESIREPSVDEEYELVKDILRYALEKKEYVHMQKIAFVALTSNKFIPKYDINYKVLHTPNNSIKNLPGDPKGKYDERSSKLLNTPSLLKNIEDAEMFLIALFACIYNNDAYHGYTIVRDIVLHAMDNNLAWNLLNLIIQSSDEIRHIKFINRLQMRVPLEGLDMIEANNELTVGNVGSALKYYMKEFKKNPSPYLSFMLGVVILQIYNQRHHTDKKALAQSVTYLFQHYSKFRSKHAQHEVYYNLGRMYHQLGIMYLAEHYYKLVLDFSNDFTEKEPDLLGLKHEAAYNLHLIYKTRGNLIEARNVILKHLVI